jgi:hypothetical protein
MSPLAFTPCPELAEAIRARLPRLPANDDVVAAARERTADRLEFEGELMREHITRGARA